MQHETMPDDQKKLDKKSAVPQEMIETTDLPPDTGLREEYNAMDQNIAENSEIVILAEDMDDSADSEFDENGRRRIKISCHSCGQKLDLTPLEPFSRIPCPVCGADLIVPAWFDSYLLEEKGGNGGMATVYRALDLALDREVAIKVLRSDFSCDGNKSEMFLNEARAAATINHYAVIPIYTCGIFENQPYIVMQYMSGGSLEDLLKTSPHGVSLPKAFAWMHDVAEGLENARQHGVVHHDIKPGNIMLDMDGKAKIGDFGIARIATNGEDNVKQTCSWVSPHYASPEKIRTGVEDHRGDIYSLGATFYHLVTGFTPFPDKDLDELLRARLSADPMAPNLQRLDLPERISTLILAMMDRDPERRPDYPAIIAILKEFMEWRSPAASHHTTARDKSTPCRPPAPHTPGSGSPKAVYGKRKPIPLPPSPQPKRRSPLWFFSNLLTVILVLGVAVVFANKYGYLDRFAGVLPKFLQKTKKDPAAEIILNAILVQAFRCGNTSAILKDGEALLQSHKRAKRMQAALQLCYAAFLENDPKHHPVEYSEQILRAMERTLPPVEKIRFEDHLALIRYLAGHYANTDGIEHDCRFPHTEDFKAKKALAVLLFRFQTEPELSADERQSLMDSFAGNLRELMALRCWMYAAFSERLSAWEQAVKKRSGIKDEIEPLFRNLITTEAEWENPPGIPFQKPLITGHGKTAGNKPASGQEAGNPENKPFPMPELSEDKLQENAEKYASFQRPRPENPMSFFLNDGKVWTYYQNIGQNSNEEMDENAEDKLKKQKEQERKRLNELLKLKSYLFELSVSRKNPCPIDDLVWKNAIHYGKGTLTFYDKYIEFRGENEKTPVRLKWGGLPVETMLQCLRYYAEWRENLSISDTGENATIQQLKSKQADSWIRFALLAAWYERYDEAADALRKATELCPVKEVAERLENLFLK